MSPAIRHTLICLLLSLAGQFVRAAEPAQPPPDAGPKLIRQTRYVSERGNLPSYTLVSGTNQLSFVPPNRWNVRMNTGSQDVTLLHSNLAESITFKLVLGTNNPSTTNRLIELAQQQHPGAVGVRTFNFFCLDQAGTAMDFEIRTTNTSRTVIRSAFVPLTFGELEFQVSAPASQFPAAHQAFMHLSSSFQSLGSLKQPPPRTDPKASP